MPDFTWDVIVVGGGAAGLMCAIEAGKRGRRVLLLEHNAEVGRKILISGGGRCNFTNLHTKPANFLSANPHFAKSALARYGPQEFIALVQKHAIPYHEKTLGQLFCDRSARDIVDMLLRECALAGVQIETGCVVREVQKEIGFVSTTANATFRSASLVIATGGLSVPKMGATPFGYRIAEQFGLGIVECRPALVPFTFSREDRESFGDLAGVSTEVVGGRLSREDALHASGPERSRDPAGILLLEPPRNGRDRPAAGSRRCRRVACAQGAPSGAERPLAQTHGGPLGGKARRHSGR